MCVTDCRSTCGLVAMTSASHAEGRQLDPGQVYFVVLTDARAVVELQHTGHELEVTISTQTSNPVILHQLPL